MSNAASAVTATGELARGAPAPRPAPHVPALVIAAALAAGIVGDRYFPLELTTWLLVAGGAVLGWCLLDRVAATCARKSLHTRQKMRRLLGWGAMVCTLCAACATGGAWHHLRWSVLASDDLVTYAVDAGQPVCVVGELVESPFVVRRPSSPIPSAVPQYDRTVATLRCQQLRRAGESRTVSGYVRLDVEGHLPPLVAGDTLSVYGDLYKPVGARNPGGFDFRDALRRLRIHAVVRVDTPVAVRVERRGATGLTAWTMAFGRWSSGLRQRAEQVLRGQLSTATADLGVALWLGARTGLAEDVRLAFAESGMLHILAISGANVAVLAALLWWGARLLGLGENTTIGLILLTTSMYTIITELQPPVLRATLMIGVVLAGLPRERSIVPVNLWGAAVLGVLLWNPLHLFDVGAQLSFLSVAALMWVPTFERHCRRTLGRLGILASAQSAARAVTPEEAADLANAERVATPTGPSGRLARLGDGVCQFIAQLGRAGAGLLWTATIATCAIWIFTLPLALARFQLFSPIGLVGNVLLVVPMTVLLWTGYLLLLVGLPIPEVVGPLGTFCDWQLRGLVAAVKFLAAVPGGHMYVPGPSLWWLTGFYVLLFALVWISTQRERRTSLGWQLVLAWCALGSVWGARPEPQVGLRCDVLGVGHGMAILVTTPDRRTLLYDVGQLQEGRRAARAVHALLAHRGQTTLDALVLSHADVDHFNGVPDLLNVVSVRAAYLHRSLLHRDQPGVDALCESLAMHGVPARLVWEGDRLRLGDGDVTIEVLHPPAVANFAKDNEASVVLRIGYKGRSVLLTGDLEGAGLAAWLRNSGERSQADVLVAPHHGSRKSNTSDVARATRPRYVIVSDGAATHHAFLQETYGPECPILSTIQHGALSVLITPEGTLTVTPTLR